MSSGFDPTDQRGPHGTALPPRPASDDCAISSETPFWVSDLAKVWRSLHVPTRNPYAIVTDCAPVPVVVNFRTPFALDACVPDAEPDRVNVREASTPQM